MIKLEGRAGCLLLERIHPIYEDGVEGGWIKDVMFFNGNKYEKKMNVRVEQLVDCIKNGFIMKPKFLHRVEGEILSGHLCFCNYGERSDPSELAFSSMFAINREQEKVFRRRLNLIGEDWVLPVHFTLLGEDEMKAFFPKKATGLISLKH